MEKRDLVLNLHGEVPYPSQKCSLEEAFLPTLKDLHERFPKLRIVLENIALRQQRWTPCEIVARRLQVRSASCL